MIQYVGNLKLDRVLHVWLRRGERDYKCVLCGAVSKQPTTNGAGDRYEPLTDKERAMCPAKP